MSAVITKFAVTSMVMWMAPVAIVYGFYYQIFPGVSKLSPSAQTMASGFLAVISVNLVIGFYIYMAMKETPHQEPQPDPAFLANAKASINQPTSSQNSWMNTITTSTLAGMTSGNMTLPGNLCPYGKHGHHPCTHEKCKICHQLKLCICL